MLIRNFYREKKDKKEIDAPVKKQERKEEFEKKAEVKRIDPGARQREINKPKNNYIAILNKQDKNSAIKGKWKEQIETIKLINVFLGNHILSK